MTDKKTIFYYSTQAEQLSAQYDSIDFVDVHGEWMHHIPEKGWALDVGAGSGRDSAFLAKKGFSVVAVEPAKGMRELAQKKQIDANIHWLDDSLPELRQVFSLQIKFDLILLSAVWMHLAPTHRERAFRKLSSLLKPNGKLIISLRHGECRDGRVMYSVSSEEHQKLASKFGLSFELASEKVKKDQMGRSDVSWETVVLTLPDDGTGAFPLIRNIVVNDNKASTYKIALLRSVLRIAEAHAGAVIDQSDDLVELPLGLVAFYWLKLYRPLIDVHKMQQLNNPNKGLGFVSQQGWRSLGELHNNDLYLGASFANQSLSQALHRTIKDIANTIKDMPAKYIKLPGTQEQVFSVKANRVVTPSSITLNHQYLGSFGSFYVPKRIWDAMTQFSIWIEPAIVNEWATLMANYASDMSKFSPSDYLNALRWDDPMRSTSRVRRRVDALLDVADVSCVWTGQSIRRAKRYAVDHAIPFSRWPNNDLWNLLPTKVSVNANKSDKLPSAHKLISCRQDIVDWWQLAWANEPSEFFTQASLALPRLGTDNRSYDDVFEAFLLQRNRILHLQQLAEWQ
ncbi:methyltransferase domain-containing protein [Glaciecola sp. SC05]|uniref:methyltransferase domain-containing protein n=1 Tax=Glaciecola sp. SC05 TaxID=1987355 RepID=UPI003527A507